MTPSKYLPVSWFDPRTEQCPSPIHGDGQFATAPIRAGEVVLIWGGAVYTAADFFGRMDLGPVSYSLIEEDLVMAAPPQGRDYYINHSCDPNVWMADNVTVVARRDIAAGEECTGDYAIWEGEAEYRLEPCTCGSSLCRTTITGNDWLRPELQVRYAGHFLPYLNERIRKQAGLTL
ncbi:MAG TPA: SET domain-containing protein-lysine N-methyltransferase [Chloroflexia bacterium]|nr:SET domain-containing protein-lysine N-methyltransferase [Chloroflexia bacterium]